MRIPNRQIYVNKLKELKLPPLPRACRLWHDVNRKFWEIILESSPAAISEIDLTKYKVNHIDHTRDICDLWLIGEIELRPSSLAYVIEELNDWDFKERKSRIARRIRTSGNMLGVWIKDVFDLVALRNNTLEIINESGEVVLSRHPSNEALIDIIGDDIMIDSIHNEVTEALQTGRAFLIALQDAVVEGAKTDTNELVINIGTSENYQEWADLIMMLENHFYKGTDLTEPKFQDGALFVFILYCCLKVVQRSAVRITLGHRNATGAN